MNEVVCQTNTLDVTRMIVSGIQNGFDTKQRYSFSQLSNSLVKAIVPRNISKKSIYKNILKYFIPLEPFLKCWNRL